MQHLQLSTEFSSQPRSLGKSYERRVPSIKASWEPDSGVSSCTGCTKSFHTRGDNSSKTYTCVLLHPHITTTHNMWAENSSRTHPCVSLHHCIATSLHCYISTLLHQFIATSLHCYITALLHHYIGTSLHCYITRLLHHYVSTPPNTWEGNTSLRVTASLRLYNSYSSNIRTKLITNTSLHATVSLRL